MRLGCGRWRGCATSETRTRWALLRLCAGRLAFRERPAAARVRIAGFVAVAVALGCAVAIALGAHHVALLVALALASLIALPLVCLRLFPAAMAVSVVGIALSCASLMTSLAVTSGFLSEISRAVARFNGHVLMTKYGLDFFEYEAIADRVLSDERVVAASPFAFSMVAIVPDDGATPATTSSHVTGVDPSSSADPWAPALAAEARGLTQTERAQAKDEPARGPAIVVAKGIDPRRAAGLRGLSATFHRGDLAALRPASSNTRPGIVLGVGLARELGVVVGDRVRVVVPAEIDGAAASAGAPPRHATFDVLDLLEVGVGEFDRQMALMHITAGQALFFREGRVTGIEFELTEPSLADAVVADWSAELPQMYRLSTWRESNSDLLLVLEQVRIVLSLVLGLMVLVGAASLVASLLLVIRRKHHDIGVLLAVGCDGWIVFWVFELVGLVAGAVGAVLGVALGAFYCAVIAAFDYPLATDVYPLSHLPVQIAVVDVVVPVAVVLVLCGVASGPVARMAARVRIIGALGR